jgi:electron transfer flavoprotein beta subunit
VASSVRIAVLVEQGWDPASVELDPGGQAVDETRAVSVASPGALEAVEVGLRLGAVTACAVGGPETDGVLREALALGAGGAVRAADLEGLAEALQAEAFDLVLASWRSGHQSPNPLSPLLAGLLDLPQATAVDELEPGEGEVAVRRRLDRGERERLVLPLPAVLALEPGLVTPRTGSPAAVLAARDAEIRVLEPAGNGAPRPRLLGHQAPRPAAPRSRAPDPGLPAEARIARVVGLFAEGRPRELAAGSPAEVAARIVAFLEERGLL